jgi:PAS domain S-box-containing protein
MNTLPEITAGRPATETILIVDDDREAAKYIETLMQYEGFTTRVAHCGAEALEFIKQKPVDLVLLDVLMPDMNGVDVARAMKKNAGKDFLPIILVSALSTEADKVGGLTYADDYLTKPFSSEELPARVKALLRIKQLHRELSLSKSRYEGLYENFPHLYVSIDSKRLITECNRFFRQTFSAHREDIIGTSFYSLFREQDRPHVESFLNSFSLSDLPSVGQRTFTIIRTATNEPLQLSLKAVYTGEADDNLNIVIAMEDITEQVRMQEQQKIARQQLYRSARLASIGTLASGVAHEINNPLTAILGFSSALLGRIRAEEPIEGNDLKEYLEVINTEALRCRDIVENLSKFAREGEVAMVNVKLRTCVEDAVKLTHSRAAKANITIEMNVDSGAIVVGDANKLEQVFINIIANSIDFCPSGSKVTIRNVPSDETERYCRIIVADNGPGIGADILPKVFDPFFTTKEVGEGTGMGLAICYKIIEECNGRIDITSEPGGGTTVILDVPVV